MYCPKCGTENDDRSIYCTHCGNRLSASEATDIDVKDYLPYAILVTIFCFLPIGVVAIVFAVLANNKLEKGDFAGALEYSEKAKMWCWIAFDVGIAIVALLSIFYAIVLKMIVSNL